MCEEKQSVKHVYFHGTSADCRAQIYLLREKREQIDISFNEFAESIPDQVLEDLKHKFESDRRDGRSCLAESNSKWDEFQDELENNSETLNPQRQDKPKTFTLNQDFTHIKDNSEEGNRKRKSSLKIEKSATKTSYQSSNPSNYQKKAFETVEQRSQKIRTIEPSASKWNAFDDEDS